MTLIDQSHDILVPTVRRIRTGHSSSPPPAPVVWQTSPFFATELTVKDPQQACQNLRLSRHYKLQYLIQVQCDCVSGTWYCISRSLISGLLRPSPAFHMGMPHRTSHRYSAAALLPLHRYPFQCRLRPYEPRYAQSRDCYLSKVILFKNLTSPDVHRVWVDTQLGYGVRNLPWREI